MTRLAPHTVALRDQIVSAVAAAFPAPISSNAQGPTEIEILECHNDEYGEWHLIRRPRNSQDIQKHLAGLWRRGLIVKLPYNRSANPCTRWTVNPDAAAAQVLTALAESWSRS